MLRPFPVSPMLAKATREMPDDGRGRTSRSGTGSAASSSATATTSSSAAATRSRSPATSPSSLDPLRAALPERCGRRRRDRHRRPNRPRLRPLSQRIHPAASRIEALAGDHPASFVAFDLLAVGDDDLRAAPFADVARGSTERSRSDAAPGRRACTSTPATTDPDIAADWFERFEGAGLDGVVAKALDGCVPPGRAHDAQGQARAHRRLRGCGVPHAQGRWRGSDRCSSGSSTTRARCTTSGSRAASPWRAAASWSTSSSRTATAALDGPPVERLGRGGPAERPGRQRMPGGQTRWTGGKDLSWEPLRPELVCEVAYDHLQGDRFRHATRSAGGDPTASPRRALTPSSTRRCPTSSTTSSACSAAPRLPDQRVVGLIGEWWA